MPGRFVVKKGSTGKYRFNLVATNGQIVAVRRLAADAMVEDLATGRADVAGGRPRSARGG
jgi:hypothetical protein